jgi:hypothetical protein
VSPRNRKSLLLYSIAINLSTMWQFLLCLF